MPSDNDDADNENASSNYVAAIGRGFDVIRAFGSSNPVLTGSEIAARTGISRPTVRRLLLTLEQLGYVTKVDGGYALTVRTLGIGTACVSALDQWELARPHLVRLVELTGESSAMAQLEGSDIVYHERVTVPKVLALRVKIGYRFPAAATAMGRVLLAELSEDELASVLAIPSQSLVVPRLEPTLKELSDSLAAVRERGWAVSDQLLTFGVRSIAAPVRSASGEVVAAINVAAHAADTPLDQLLNEYLPHLLDTAAAVTDEWSKLALLPFTELSMS